MEKQFIKDARSFYNHRMSGSDNFRKAKDYSKDPLEVYNEVLHKKTMEIIFDSAKNDYKLDLSRFEILELFLFYEERPYYYRGRPALKRTKFRQPKGQKIPKKKKKEKVKKFKDKRNASWRSQKSAKWNKRQRAKSHRQWVRESLNLFEKKGVDRFCQATDKEYKFSTEPWWW